MRHNCEKLFSIMPVMGPDMNPKKIQLSLKLSVCLQLSLSASSLLIHCLTHSL